ncbi:MAG: hypothetical protein H6711_24810 [Myxococcales bacterium]|nr:hypothetical protein [Myxococcales bacterium]
MSALGLLLALALQPAEAAPAAAPVAPAAAPASAGSSDPRGGVEVIEPVAESAAAPPAPAPEPALAPVGKVVEGPAGPPYYSPADEAGLRVRYSLDPTPPAPDRTPPRWRCFIADPRCSFNVEINATSAYAYRAQQGDVTTTSGVYRWSSARAQYDLWVNLPALYETHGRNRYTRLTIGPKGGVIVSDSKTIWGNAGLAMRYWFNHGRFSPTIEFSTALTFRLAARDDMVGGAINTRRSPPGVTMDVGVGLGGFGALIFGGQYDAPLVREDVPEVARVYPSGMFFVGFRGNIVWGAPAALAVGTHALSQKVNAPARP